MSLHIKQLHDGGLQVENDAGNWLLFTLDELRSRSTTLSPDAIGGEPRPKDADLFVWSAFAAARGYAIEHGLIEDARPNQPAP